MAKVLIVEDDLAINKAYKIILEREGHEVETAFNGQEGLDRAARLKPDVILLDIMMPVMDGIEFLRNYDLKKNKDVIVIVLTNLDQNKEVQEAMSLGAYKYILKAHTPPNQLAVQVNHLLKKNIVKSDEEEE